MYRYKGKCTPRFSSPSLLFLFWLFAQILYRLSSPVLSSFFLLYLTSLPSLCSSDEQSGFVQARQGSTGVSEVRFLFQDDFVVSCNSQGHLFVWQIKDANEKKNVKKGRLREQQHPSSQSLQELPPPQQNDLMPLTRQQTQEDEEDEIDKTISTRLRFTSEA